jgi:hypothetical protein
MESEVDPHDSKHITITSPKELQIIEAP